MCNRSLFSLALLVVAISPQQSLGQQSTPTHPTLAVTSGIVATKAGAPHAQWSTVVASVLSVPSEVDFNKAGLYKLTPEELETLMADAGYLPRTNYSCGPMRTTAQDFEKIRVLVSFSDNTPVEIQSAVLQKLRNLSDVEVVYDRKEADTEVRILGFEDTTQSQTELGFTLSMAVTSPCTTTINTNVNYPVDDLQDYELFTGANVEAVATPAVAALDAKSFEGTRKLNASIRKLVHPK